MKMLATSAETIPLWVGKEGESPPSLCGAIPPEANYVASAGDMAAALVRSTDGDGDENWILAEVVSYNPTSGKYEVGLSNLTFPYDDNFIGHSSVHFRTKMRFK